MNGKVWWLLRKIAIGKYLNTVLVWTPPQAHVEEAVYVSCAGSTRGRVDKGRSQCKMYSEAGTAVGDLWKMDKTYSELPHQEGMQRKACHMKN